MFLGVALYLGQLFFNLQCTTLYKIQYLALLSATVCCCFCCCPLLGSWFNAAVAALLLLLLCCSAAAAVLLLLLPLILGRTIVCSAVLPSAGLKLATAPLVLGRTSLTRPIQDSVAASLSLVWGLIRSLDEDLRQTSRIHIPIVLVHQLQCYSPPLQVK